MSTQVRYFRSQNYIPGEELPEDRALAGGFYVRAVFDGDTPLYAEVFARNTLQNVIHYGCDLSDPELLPSHRRRYGTAALTAYAPPVRAPEGELHTLKEWEAKSDLFFTTKRLVDPRGEPLREEIFDSQGAFRGVRRFEYEGAELTRIVFTRADGVEIVELED